jgi:phosphoribosylanthranilate isomerase
MTRIKICGIRTEEQAMAAAKAGADYIGLVFATSPRQVTPEAAARITAILKKDRANTEAVGVFVNNHASAVNRIVENCRLSWVQLSGDEPWEYCREIEKPVIKVMQISRERSVEGVLRDIEYGLMILEGRKVMILLDTKSGDKYGGTGRSFDWELAQPVARQFPVIIAGGLTPGNVSRAIKMITPWGVDVSTGVETRGVKDAKKIKKFIEAVRRTDAGT